MLAMVSYMLGRGMLAELTYILDWFGLVVFAVSGALVASRKQMDIVGFAMLATVTGIGGGTLRDLVLGLAPVFWVQQPAYVGICVLVAAIMFFVAHIPQSRITLLLWLDAVGLALFSVTGAETATIAGADPIVSIAMGMITATFGGIIRDLLGGETPIVQRPEIYLTAALAGAAVFVGLMRAGIDNDIALVGGFTAAFLLRAAALYWGWSLPRYRARPGK